LGLASEFINQNIPSYLKIYPKLDPKHVGMYSISIKLKDSNINPLSATYSFKINVLTNYTAPPPPIPMEILFKINPNKA
jgi:hypothetical protein